MSRNHEATGNLNAASLPGDAPAAIQPLTFPPLPAEPLFSVLISSYNYAPYVGRAIQSVLDQTYQRFEVIVCDDGSSDDSCAVIEAYVRQDARVRLIRQANGGQASALNAAYQLATGHLIGWLDSDDEWYPPRLAKVVAAFRRCPEAGLVTHMLRHVHVNGEVLQERLPREPWEGWLAPAILRGATPHFPGVAASWRRELGDFLFPLPLPFTGYPDLVLNARGGLVARVVAIREPLAIWRRHGTNQSGNGDAMSLAEVTRYMALIDLMLDESEATALAVHGVRVAPAVRDAWARASLRKFQVVQAFLAGKRLVPAAIAAHVAGLRGWLWQLMFVLPRPLAVALYRWWWRTRLDPLKRLLMAFRGPSQW